MLRPAPASACLPAPGPDGFYGIYRSDPWAPGQVVLTFDDGPHVVYTKRVLALLARHQLSATFFLVGQAINPRTYALVQRIVAEGHLLGSHSYSHDVTMAFRADANGVEYIRGQHEVTEMLIELALLSESPDDFAALYAEVFERGAWQLLSSNDLRDHWREYRERHAQVLGQRGFSAGTGPYRVLYSRPPGGGPYLSAPGPAARRYDAALRELGWLNILWHGGSRDTDQERGKELGFLLGNMRYSTRRGGVLLMHEAMLPDALDRALARIAGDPRIEVISLARAAEHKFGCTSEQLREELAKLKDAAAPGEPR